MSSRVLCRRGEIISVSDYNRKKVVNHCENSRKHIVTPAYGDGLQDLCFGGALVPLTWAT